MIDRRHPDGGLLVLYISYLFEMLYPSFSFFFYAKYLSFAHVCEYTNIYSVILVMFRRLVYSVATRCERIDIFVFAKFISRGEPMTTPPIWS